MPASEVTHSGPEHAKLGPPAGGPAWGGYLGGSVAWDSEGRAEAPRAFVLVSLLGEAVAALQRRALNSALSVEPQPYRCVILVWAEKQVEEPYVVSLQI